jgi:hypothetical protein
LGYSGGGASGGDNHPSSSTEGSQPTRPIPRHFRDLPASLAFQPMGLGDLAPGNIIGQMATSAAVHKRWAPEPYAEIIYLFIHL